MSGDELDLWRGGGLGGVISTEPTVEIKYMANIIKRKYHTIPRRVKTGRYL